MARRKFLRYTFILDIMAFEIRILRMAIPSIYSLYNGAMALCFDQILNDLDHTSLSAPSQFVRG